MFDYLTVIDIVTRYARTASDSIEDDLECPHCEAPHLVRVAMASNPDDFGQGTRWLRCVGCGQGSVIDDAEVLHPSPKPMRVPDGLPPVDVAIWDEIRACLGIGAYTAAVMLCRKLLFHVAVSHGLEEKDSRNRAPSYMEAVKHLESEGVFTARMRKWVDRVKDVGNNANHELSPISRSQAFDVATFTEKLLELAYELDARYDKAAEGSDDDPIEIGTPQG